MKPISPIVAALDMISYDWLSTQNPVLLDAIEREIAAGKTPQQCMRLAAEHIGPDREGMAKRIFQAASHVQRMEVAR